MRTELTGNLKKNVNALASSIVLVCRPRAAGAGYQTLARFRAELQAELPAAMRVLQQGGIAAVDLPQAAIGPGMSIYSRYDRITDLQGTPLTVRQALKEINAALDATLSGEDLDLDDASRWALAWYKQYGWGQGPFGDADNLARARNTSVQALAEAGLVQAGKGQVSLTKREKLAWPVEREPESAWLRCQLLVRALDEGGRKEAGRLWKLFNGHESARQLAYTLFSVSEKRKDLKEARVYNDLIAEWPQIEKAARELSDVVKAGDQGKMF
jgi:putative DNA methylase